MKVCFLANQLSLEDGWSRYSINLLRYLFKKGITGSILLAENAREDYPLPVEKHKILPPLFVGRIQKTASFIKNYSRIEKHLQSADLIHSLVEPYAPVVYLAGKKPSIITLHGTYAVYPFRDRLSAFFYKQAYRSANRLVCVSHFTQRKLLTKMKLDNTLVINNGVNYERFQIDYAPVKKGKMILSVGTVMPRKGYHISIPAVARAKKIYPDLKYFIVGSQKNQSYLNYLKRMVDDYDLDNSVEFLKGVSDEDLVKLYYQADLFLLTSVNVDSDKFEGFGQVFLEANACGLPVVAADGSGAEDAVRNGDNGILVSQKDIEAAGQAVLSLLQNRELARKLGENGKKRAREASWPKVADKYIQLYHETVR